MHSPDNSWYSSGPVAWIWVLVLFITVLVLDSVALPEQEILRGKMYSTLFSIGEVGTPDRPPAISRHLTTEGSVSLGQTREEGGGKVILSVLFVREML